MVFKLSHICIAGVNCRASFATEFKYRQDLSVTKNFFSCRHSLSLLMMPPTGPQFTVEQLNFFKFQSIVRDEFPEAMRLVFKTMWDKRFPAQPWDDSVAVRNQLKSHEALNPQSKKIPTHTSYKTWDCTALVQATIFAFSFKDPATGQILNKKYLKSSAPPLHSLRSAVIDTGNQDETFALAIDQLRLIRNEVAHAFNTKIIDKTTFHHYIYHTKKVFEAIEYSTKFTDDISKIPEAEFPTGNVAKLKKIIDAMRNDKCKLGCIFGLVLVILFLILSLIGYFLTLSLTGYDILYFFKSPGPSGKSYNGQERFES